MSTLNTLNWNDYACSFFPKELNNILVVGKEYQLLVEYKNISPFDIVYPQIFFDFQRNGDYDVTIEHSKSIKENLSLQSNKSNCFSTITKFKINKIGTGIVEFQTSANVQVKQFTIPIKDKYYTFDVNYLFQSDDEKINETVLFLNTLPYLRQVEQIENALFDAIKRSVNTISSEPLSVIDFQMSQHQALIKEFLLSDQTPFEAQHIIENTDYIKLIHNDKWYSINHINNVNDIHMFLFLFHF